MTRITALDLSPFYRSTIGIDSLFDRIVSQIDNSVQSNNNYPPFNIIKVTDDHYQVQVAVAGFEQGEVEVTFHDGQLTITGERREPENVVNYLHRGISARKFVRSWPVSEYVEVEGAVVKDGILTVDLKRHVPESLKPKTVAITYANSK